MGRTEPARPVRLRTIFGRETAAMIPGIPVAKANHCRTIEKSANSRSPPGVLRMIRLTIHAPEALRRETASIGGETRLLGAQPHRQTTGELISRPKRFRSKPTIAPRDTYCNAIPRTHAARIQGDFESGTQPGRRNEQNDQRRTAP
jgi:hypothetical protein